MAEKIIQICRSVLSSPQWDLYSNLDLKEEPNPFVIGGSIDRKWNIHITIDPNIEQICQNTTTEYQLAPLLPDPVITLVSSVLRHEYLHWKVCPFDQRPFEDIVAGCSDGLIRSGFASLDDSDVQKRNQFINALRYCMNTFEDIIANTVGANTGDGGSEFSRGMALFHLNHASLAKKIGTQQNKSDTVWMDVGTRLWEENDELYHKLAQRYHPEYGDLKGSVENAVYGIVHNRALTQRAMDRTLSTDDRAEIAGIVADNSNNCWYYMARAFTLAVAPHLTEESPQHHSAGSYLLQELFGPLNESQTSGNIEFLLDEKSSQGSGKPEDKDGKGKGVGEDNGNEEEGGKGQGGNGKIEEEDEGADDAQGSKKGDQGDLYDQMNKGVLRRLAQIGTEKGMSINYAQEFDLLDSLYRQRAEEIVINLLDKKKDALTTRIADLTTTMATPETLDLRRVKWGRTRMYHTQEGKRVVLYQGDLPLEIDDPLLPSKHNIPDLCWILDSSGTMRSDLIEGTGPYDLLMRSIYSKLAWIERTKKAYQMYFACLNFSGRTIFSGWKPYSEIDEVKKDCFLYQGGGTVLDPKKVKELYTKRIEPFLAVMISDCLLHNPDRAGAELQRLVEAGNVLAIIHTKGLGRGGNSSSNRFLDIMKDHAEIHTVEDPRDIIGIEISYGKRYWGDLVLSR